MNPMTEPSPTRKLDLKKVSMEVLDELLCRIEEPLSILPENMKSVSHAEAAIILGIDNSTLTYLLDLWGIRGRIHEKPLFTEHLLRSIVHRIAAEVEDEFSYCWDSNSKLSHMYERIVAEDGKSEVRKEESKEALQTV